MVPDIGRGSRTHGLLVYLYGPGRREEHTDAHLVGSWIAIGPNHAITPDVLCTVIGPETVARIADEMGLSERAAAERLARMLPYVLDKLTPAGYVPAGGLGDIGELLGRIGRG